MNLFNDGGDVPFPVPKTGSVVDRIRQTTIDPDFTRANIGVNGASQSQPGAPIRRPPPTIDVFDTSNGFQKVGTIQVQESPPLRKIEEHTPMLNMNAPAFQPLPPVGAAAAASPNAAVLQAPPPSQTMPVPAQTATPAQAPAQPPKSLLSLFNRPEAAPAPPPPPVGAVVVQWSIGGPQPQELRTAYDDVQFDAQEDLLIFVGGTYFPEPLPNVEMAVHVAGSPWVHLVIAAGLAFTYHGVVFRFAQVQSTAQA